jgi:hypothetical protein
MITQIEIKMPNFMLDARFCGGQELELHHYLLLVPFITSSPRELREII